VLIAETGPVNEWLRVREIDDDEGRRLVRIIRRGAGSVVTWRRAQMVLLSAQGMDVAAIAKVAFTSEDRVRDVIRNFNTDGFGSLYPKYKGGHPPKFMSLSVIPSQDGPGRRSPIWVFVVSKGRQWCCAERWRDVRIRWR
jgi:Winged helix-turn helix